MLDINIIRENPAGVAKAIAKRGIEVDLTPAVRLDEQKRNAITKMEALRAEKNKMSADIAKANPADRPKLIAGSKVLGADIEKLEHSVETYEKKLFDILAALPNTPLPDVVEGGKESNRVIKQVGKMPKFDFTPVDHYELCLKLGLIDYERAAKMSGAKTWVYTGLGARLEWALLNYMIDFHVKNGYTFIMPPHLLNYESGYSAGQFPKFQDDVFCTDTEDNRRIDPESPKFRFLLPTAETALINMHRGEIIPAEQLPIKYAAYSPCYRREAGGYRASERGMIRGHQFNKIEMFAFCKPEDSQVIFYEFVNNAEKLVEGLGLHFQTVALAAGDVSASMQKTYDIEVYIPSMNEYKEVSSASMAGDYQARRSQIRTKVEIEEKTPAPIGAPPLQKGVKTVNQFVHTLNASGLATSRLFPAIIEQFQTKDGHVVIPHALRPYMGGVKEIKPIN